MIYETINIQTMEVDEFCISSDTRPELGWSPEMSGKKKSAAVDCI